jgi:hypothetical protein
LNPGSGVGGLKKLEGCTKLLERLGNGLFSTAVAQICCNNSELVLRLVFGGDLGGCAAKLWDVCPQLAFLLSERGLGGDDGLFFTAAAVAR